MDSKTKMINILQYRKYTLEKIIWNAIIRSKCAPNVSKYKMCIKSVDRNKKSHNDKIEVKVSSLPQLNRTVFRKITTGKFTQNIS